MLTTEKLRRTSGACRADGARRPRDEPKEEGPRGARTLKAALDLAAALVILALWILGALA